MEKGDIAYSKVLPNGGPQIYIDELENAYHAKNKVRNCFLCRSHGGNVYRDNDEGPIYCKFLKQKYVSTPIGWVSTAQPNPEKIQNRVVAHAIWEWIGGLSDILSVHEKPSP